jgi:hypothetical protein
MRLYAVCKQCREKIYLRKVVSTRSDLPLSFHLLHQNCAHLDYYTSQDVMAESGTPATLGGAAIGGLIGLLGGPLGLILGGATGAFLGASSDADEEKHVKKFNRS